MADESAGRTFVLCPRRRLGRVTVASGTQYIADRAFEGRFGVTAISLPDTVVSIGASACACCWSRYVGNWVYMTSLRSVNIPSSVRYVGNSAFSNCRELDIDVVIPEGVQRIGESAFADCSKIRSLSLPRSLVEIGFQAFSNCKDIGSVRFHENLRVIGRLAFSGCTSLSSGTGGANVHFCGYNVFEKTAMLPYRRYEYGKVHQLPACEYYDWYRTFVGWRCLENGRRYDDGMLVFDLAKPGETVTMTAIWE